jgi:hypothetical protein
MGGLLCHRKDALNGCCVEITGSAARKITRMRGEGSTTACWPAYPRRAKKPGRPRRIEFEIRGDVQNGRAQAARLPRLRSGHP